HSVVGNSINLISTSRDTIIDNNFYLTESDVILLNACTYVMVSSNVFYNTASGYSDIRMTGSHYNTIIGNNLSSAGASDRGIYLHNSDYNNIIGNTTNNHDVVGIEIDAGSIGNSLSGNVCNDTTPYIDNGVDSVFKVGGDADPTVDDTYDLGDGVPLRWRDLYLSNDISASGSIVVAGTASAPTVIVSGVDLSSTSSPHGSSAIGYRDGETVLHILDDTLNKGVLHPITVTDAVGINISWTTGKI
ncbi:unnamed protein product, partial [marine sediment metagenome]